MTLSGSFLSARVQPRPERAVHPALPVVVRAPRQRPPRVDDQRQEEGQEEGQEERGQQGGGEAGGGGVAAAISELLRGSQRVRHGGGSIPDSRRSSKLAKTFQTTDMLQIIYFMSFRNFVAAIHISEIVI